MQILYSPVSLKLFGYGIKCLHDPNWTGMVLYDHIKQHVRGRIEPVDLLRKPLEKGVSFHLGYWFFDEYFSHSHIEYLHGEYAVWFVEDFYELLKFHEISPSTVLSRLVALIKYVGDLSENDEEEYYYFLNSDEGNKKLQQAYSQVFSLYEKNITSLREAYAAEFADRMLHDRQLCFYVSKLILEIGFDGCDDETGSIQWVKREYWPERVKSTLRARDRGKCTNCGTDLISELEAPVHIDHMIPLAKGGCNDIVNLQILCSPCNLRKSANEQEVKSSVPAYLTRKST